MKISRRAKYLLVLFGFIAAVTTGAVFNGCKPKGGTALQNTEDGKLSDTQLITKYCTSCHALVPAAALTNDVWQYHALLDMAHLVGISTYGTGYYKADTAKGISITDWAKIVAYYKKNAPINPLPQKRPDSLLNDWAGFKLKLPASTGGIQNAFTTMVSVDPQTHQIYSADNVTAKLYKWDNKLNPKEVTKLPSPAVSMAFVKENNYYNGIITCIGELAPKDFPNGQVISLDLNVNGALPKNIETDMSRPLQTSAIDFNKDGLQDYVVAARGKMKGHLYLLKQNTDHTYSRTDLKTPEGAVQTITGDFNKDGWPDIMALFGGGNEGVSLFTNNKAGGFTERRLLSIPPVYGSSSLQLADVDNDGDLDVIITCGYNYLDSRIKKPYHGLYVYQNTGNWALKETFFYPINGCTKAIAADFDGDGDIDIATSAFFADLQSQPAESFIYFEQDKKGHYKPHAIPVSKYGRWFDMALGDYNGDGKPDIILGNYYQGLNVDHSKNPYNNGNNPLIVLENHTGK